MGPTSGETFRDQLDELRCHETSWLRQERARVITDQRRLKVRELALTKVLDERDALDPMPDASIPAHTAKATVEVARSLESLPALADRAVTGELSWEQLEPLTRIATPETDREWARRGRNCTPLDLQKRARRAQPVTAADAQARYQARGRRIWREAELGMIAGRFRLPDLDGILVEKVLDHMAEQMRPNKGEAWDSLEHRYADGFLELCRTYADVEPTGRFKFTIVAHRREDGTADCDGLDNLARVCPYHHRMLIPNGPWVLTGDPNQIDGLRLVHQDDLIDAPAGPAP